MKHPSTVHHIPAYELKLIFDWADYARTSDEFWARVLLASAAYGPRVQVKMARVVALCMAEPREE